MNIFNHFAGLVLGFPKIEPFEEKLRSGILMFDRQTRSEVESFIQSQFSPEGGFANRAGEADLYYTLFGYYVSEALGMKGFKNKIVEFTRKEIITENQGDVHLFCKTILLSNLAGTNRETRYLSRQIKTKFKTFLSGGTDYTLFLGLLALSCLEEYFFIMKYLNKIGKADKTPAEEAPCPVVAAQAVLLKAAGKDTEPVIEKLFGFYADGGFKALKNAPSADLLSTAVALFALNFCGADLRVIKPACLNFTESLYSAGGFTATRFDFAPDIEYTFYGLLALGSLNN